MKKSFLIVGAMAAILSTNGYAVQSGGGITPTCTGADGQKCFVKRKQADGGVTYSCDCIPEEPNQKPVLIFDNVANPNQGYVVQQSQIESIEPIKQKKAKKVSARAAEMPKAIKKIVYEEVVSDDAE